MHPQHAHPIAKCYALIPQLQRLHRNLVSYVNHTQCVSGLHAAIAKKQQRFCKVSILVVTAVVSLTLPQGVQQLGQARRRRQGSRHSGEVEIQVVVVGRLVIIGAGVVLVVVVDVVLSKGERAGSVSTALEVVKNSRFLTTPNSTARACRCPAAQACQRCCRQLGTSGPFAQAFERKRSAVLTRSSCCRSSSRRSHRQSPLATLGLQKRIACSQCAINPLTRCPQSALTQGLSLCVWRPASF